MLTMGNSSIQLQKYITFAYRTLLIRLTFMSMKKVYVVLLILTCQYVYGQTLEENKADEVTKAFVKRTSWVALTPEFSITAMYLRISKLDSLVYLDFKYAGTGNLLNIDTGNEFIFVLDNDQTLSIPAREPSSGCTGCGAVGPGFGQAPGIQAKYLLGTDAIGLLLKHKNKEIRFNSSDGFIDEMIQLKNADILKKSLELIR
jgi:hypothetical protein